MEKYRLDCFSMIESLLDDILFDLLTVREQLEFYCIARGYANEKEKICDELLQSVHLSNDEKSFCQNLSGGMKRRLSIACAFLGEMKIVLLGLFCYRLK